MLLDLQRLAGNSAVVGMLAAQRQPSDGAPAIQVRGEPVDKIGLVDNDGLGGGKASEPGVNLRSVPADTGNVPIGRLPHNQRLYIKARAENDWLYVVATDGRSGYVSGAYVRTEDDMPDPGARLHRITPGETAFDIVGTHYGAAAYKKGQDARFYSNVLVYANNERNRFGIRKPTDAEKWQLIKEIGYDKYLDAWTVAGAQIWIPSKEFADALKGQVSSGSFARDTWEKIKRFGARAAEFLVRIPAFVGGLLVGVVESLWDAVKGVVDLVKSIVTGDIVGQVGDLVDMLRDKEKRAALIAALKEQAGEYATKWDHGNPLKKWYWRGWIIGYVVGEVLGNLLAPAAGALLKATKFGTKFVSLVKGLGPIAKAVDAASALRRSRPVVTAGKILGGAKRLPSELLSKLGGVAGAVRDQLRKLLGRSRRGRQTAVTLTRAVRRFIERVRRMARRIFDGLGFKRFEVTTTAEWVSLYGIKSRWLLARFRRGSVQRFEHDARLAAALRAARARYLQRARRLMQQAKAARLQGAHAKAARLERQAWHMRGGKAVRESERIGERAAEAALKRQLGRVTKRYTGHGSGTLDQVFELPDGTLAIVEAKGGAGRMGGRAARGGVRAQQGTVTYLREVLRSMKKRGGRHRTMAEDIEAALAKGKVRYFLAKTPLRSPDHLATKLSEFRMR